MFNSTITRLVVMLFALTLLASGCAKKPMAEEPTMAEETTQIEMQQEPSGIAEEGIAESAYGEQASGDQGYDAAAAAQVAEDAATSGLERIHFGFDQYVLTPEAKSVLVSNAGLLRAAPAINVMIEGHCDERGSDEYNLALGEKRALAAKNYLVSLGVAADRLNTISYGEEMPLAMGDNKEAWAKNRRAEFKVKR
jgi:peptidoglycan-associated lipoprotein